MRPLARRPAEHLPFGVASVLHHAADVPRFGIASVELPGRARAIDAEHGVMHHAGVAGPELDRTHETGTSEVNWQHEGPKSIAAGCWHDVRLRHPHDQIRFAKLPAVVPQRRHLRRMRAVAFGRTFGDPLLQLPQLDFMFGRIASVNLQTWPS